MGLLDEEWLRVLADEGQGFRVEGTLYLPLNAETPREPELPGRLSGLVAGGRFNRLHTAPRRLIVRMHFSG